MHFVGVGELHVTVNYIANSNEFAQFSYVKFMSLTGIARTYALMYCTLPDTALTQGPFVVSLLSSDV
jgi:hypothetical protein